MRLKILHEQRFQDLKDEWYQKLKEDGFKDIEDSKGRLKNYDRRTIAFENRARINQFFVSLDHFLDENEIPSRDRVILTLYSEGVRIVDIAPAVGRVPRTVLQIINKYKTIILQKITLSTEVDSDDGES